MAENPSFTMNRLASYVPPHWAECLPNPPKSFVQLAVKPTPIHKWDIPDLPSPFTVHIKRDDLTGSVLSGNKCRKAEFLLGDALEKGCDSIITCGSVWSNQARTMAIASSQLGMKCYLVLRSPDMNPEAIGCRGNFMFNRLAGAKILLVPSEFDYEKQVHPRMRQLEEKLRNEGKEPYVIEVGGSTYVSMFCEISAFEEMIEQGVLENFDDIVVTAASGGTASGLAIANYLNGQKLKVHAVCVSYDAAYIYRNVTNDLRTAGLDTKAEDILDVIEGKKVYGNTTSTAELEYIVKLSTETGILCDPSYTANTARAMMLEINRNPGRFKGSRILFIHTGGMFNLLSGCLDSFVTSSPLTNQVSVWKDVDTELMSTNESV